MICRMPWSIYIPQGGKLCYKTSYENLAAAKVRAVLLYSKMDLDSIYVVDPTIANYVYDGVWRAAPV